jgi:hypothetical protein
MDDRGPEERGCSRLHKRGRTPSLFFLTSTIDPQRPRYRITMATKFDSFRFPAQFSEFIPYLGPEESKTSQHRTLKRIEPSTDDWHEFEMLLGTVPEDLGAPRVEGVTMGPDHRPEGSSLRKCIVFTLA